MKKIERLKSFHYTSAHPIIIDKINEIIDYLNMDSPEQVGFEELWEEKNPSEFDKRLNALLKEFKSLPKEELIDSLEFYLKAIKHETPFNLMRLKEVAKPEVIKPTGVLGELLKTPPTQEELEEAERELNHSESDQELTAFEDALVDAYMSNTPIIEKADKLLSIAKKQFIDKACEWLEYNFNMPGDFEFHFRKAMEEQE